MAVRIRSMTFDCADPYRMARSTSTSCRWERRRDEEVMRLLDIGAQLVDDRR